MRRRGNTVEEAIELALLKAARWIAPLLSVCNSLSCNIEGITMYGYKHRDFPGGRK